MADARAHPLLAQVPLTVSPFISLPTAPTLGYTYKSLPSTLPPSSTGETAAGASDGHQAQYVVSASGHAAHPSEILKSCEALRSSLQQNQEKAEQSLAEWQARIKEQELAEKRRVAPGWLDRSEKILQPQRAATSSGPSTSSASILDQDAGQKLEPASVPPELSAEERVKIAEGEALDRAFGRMDVK